MKSTKVYWTHNTAYHDWILSHAKGRKNILDVGCGDGLLIQRLSKVCDSVTGIDPHVLCVLRAKRRISNISNAIITHIGFENFEAAAESFDAVIFVASLHHMDHEFGMQKAKALLISGGELLIVGCVKPCGFTDWLIEIMRMAPAKIGSVLHGEKIGGDIGVPTYKPKVCIADIRRLASRELPNSVIRRGLYYRYLLRWVKP